MVLCLGLLLWTEVIHFGVMQNFFQEFICAIVITPTLFFATLSIDKELETGNVTIITENTLIDTKAENNNRQPSQDEMIGGEQTWRLRYTALCAIFVLMMAALVRKFNHGQICFHPEDHITKEQQDLCTLGNQLMSSVDPHTKLLHRVLQGLASTRGQEYPPGTDVTIPKRKENLQKMPLFWGSAVPTYDQDNAPEELNWKQ